MKDDFQHLHKNFIFKLIIVIFCGLLSLFSCRSSSSTSLGNAKMDFKTAEFAQAMERAKVEGKPIFMDFYTSWCGPCRKMDKEVFTQPKIVNLLNASFVSLKINAEKGEGVELASKHLVRGYPTFLFLTPDGKVIDKLEGYTTASTLQTYAKKALKNAK